MTHDVMRIKLSQIQEQYELIMRGEPGLKRDLKLAALMDAMEEWYKIPIIENPTWERNNKAVIAMYRKLSQSRTTV